MFRAGQSIIITKSNLPEHRHPNVGDKGFIGNAFYVVKHGFVLMEAYFYSYPNIAEHRCERKVMVVDLTSDDSFIKAFPSESAHGIRRFIYEDGVYAINLCSPKMDILDTSEVHGVLNALYPWFEHTNSLCANKQAKIPLVKFRPLHTHDSVNESPGILCSWINSMRPYFTEAKCAEGTKVAANRLVDLIKFEKPTAISTTIYATTRHAYKWFLDIRKVAEIILIIRKLEAMLRKSKRTAITEWIKNNPLAADTKRSLYAHYSGIGMNLIGDVLDMRGLRPNTRESLIEIYCVLLNSPNLEYATSLTKDIGHAYFEVRGDYYSSRYKRMAQEVMNDQARLMKGETTIEEIFKTKYLK